MIKRLPDSFVKASVLDIQRAALDIDELLSEQPLSFQVYYAKNKQKAVVDTIYLEDGNPKLDLYLEILNESSKKIEFKNPSAAGLQTAQSGQQEYAHFNRCNFYIHIEKQIQIKLEEISIEPKEEWQVNYDENNNFVTIYFLHKKDLVLQPSNSPDNSDKVVLTFKNLAANNPIIKTTHLNFSYDSSQLGEMGALNAGKIEDEEINEIEFTEEDGIETTYPISVKTPISITHHPDKNNILLQWRFIGSNAIINDGTTVNELNLKIFNRSLLNYNRPNLLLDKMNSKFIVSFETGDKSETLTTLDKAQGISITTTDSHNWKINRTQNAAEWIIQLNNASNKDKLTAGDGIELNIKNLVTSKVSGVGYLYITYQNIGDYPDGQLVVPIEKTPLLYRGAQVGVGTNSPSAKLEINGGDIKITSEDKGILFAGGAKIYKKSGSGLKIQPHNDGHGIEFTKADGQTNVMIVKDGKVGIGTNDLSHKLHIAGENTTLRLSGTGNWGVGAKLNFGDHNEIYLTEDQDKKLLIHADTRITLDSDNVGIGTKAPSAKLEIDGGDIKIASEDKGILFAGGAKIYKKSGSGLKFQVGTIQAKYDNETLIGLEVNPTFDNNQKKNVKPLGLLVYGASATTEIETKEVVRLIRPAKDKNNSNSVGFKVGAGESGEGGKTRLDIALSSYANESNDWGNVPDVTVMSLNADGVEIKGNVQINSQYKFGKMQAGRLWVKGGDSIKKDVNTFTIQFPEAFSKLPQLVITVISENYNNIFCATVKTIYKDNALVNVLRLYKPENKEFLVSEIWAETLALDWIAWETP